MKLLSVAVLAAGWVLSGCGGGGGGGGSPASSVTLNVTGPARQDVDVYEGQTMPDLIINGTLSGDVGSLGGRTLYLVAEVPDSFLYRGASANVSTNGRSGNLQLFGATVPDGVRTYTGNVVVHACLDPACTSEISVANRSIPYTVRVRRGLHVASSDVSLETDFGTPMAPVTMGVTLPENLASWNIQPGLNNPQWGLIRAAKAEGQDAVVFSTSEQTLPGSTTFTTYVEAYTTDGVRLTRLVEVHAQTRASSAPYAFQQARLDLRLASGVSVLSDAVNISALLPAGDSQLWDFLSLDYTSAPAGADLSFLPPYGWLALDIPALYSSPRWPDRDYDVRAAVQACYNGTCLPPGRYEAVIHYRYAPAGGAVQFIDYPVTFDVVP